MTLMLKEVLIFFQGLSSSEDMSVQFSEEESALLDPDQTALHGEIIEENFQNLAFLGKLPSILPSK